MTIPPIPVSGKRQIRRSAGEAQRRRELADAAAGIGVTVPARIERFKVVIYAVGATPAKFEAALSLCLAYAERFNWAVLGAFGRADTPSEQLREREDLRLALRMCSSDTGTALLTHRTAVTGMSEGERSELARLVEKTDGFLEYVSETAAASRG